MTRAFNLSATEAEVTKYCRDKKIGISALEELPDGGVRLVCSSGDGAEQIRTKFKRHIMTERVRRTMFAESGQPLW